MLCHNIINLWEVPTVWIKTFHNTGAPYVRKSGVATFFIWLRNISTECKNTLMTAKKWISYNSEKKSVKHISQSTVKEKIAVWQQENQNKLSKGVSSDVRYEGKDHLIAVNPKQIRCAYCGKKSTRKCNKCLVGLHDKCFKSFTLNNLYI